MEKQRWEESERRREEERRSEERKSEKKEDAGTPGSEHFLKLRCRKSGRRCGAKHISKSKCTKHTRFGALFDIEMSKKCTPLWREARYKVKMLKAPHAGTTFGGSDVVLPGTRKGFCTLPKVSKT